MATNTSLANLKAIVIGAGFGGLSSAIELARRSASVRVFESVPDMSRQGDVIQIGANATRLMKPWGNVLEQVTKISSMPKIMSIMDQNGKVWLDQDLHTEFDGYPNAYGKRGAIQRALYDHAIALGVEVNFNAPVVDIFEDEKSAGVVLKGGSKHEADLVIAADGVRGQSRKHVVGVADRPQKSGFAVFRSWFSLDNLLDDPLTASIAQSKEPLFKIWIGDNIHAILTTNTAVRGVTCFVTHKDVSDISEDWNNPGDPDEMLSYVQGWDPVLLAIIKHVPRDCLIDYKLLWRDPVRKWVSDNGRVCLVGDSSHPHLATSGTGAAQALEDAATIGTLLEKMGDDRDIPLAFRAFEKLRYERTSLTQRMGWETRHVWHQTDWEAVSKNPDSIRLPQPRWLLGSDASEYAAEQFDAVISHLKYGTPFASKNIPEGHVHQDWNMETMLEFEDKKANDAFYQSRGE